MWIAFTFESGCYFCKEERYERLLEMIAYGQKIENIDDHAQFAPCMPNDLAKISAEEARSLLGIFKEFTTMKEGRKSRRKAT